jgi:hypothetical protein
MWIPRGSCFQGTVLPERSLDIALATVLAWEDTEDKAWMDGSGQDNGDVGCSVIWRHLIGDGWGGAAFHLGHNKEVFDAELYAIYEAISFLHLALHKAAITQCLRMLSQQYCAAPLTP